MIDTLDSSLKSLEVFSVEGQSVQDGDVGSSSDVGAPHGEEATADGGSGVGWIPNRSCSLEVNSTSEVCIVLDNVVRAKGLVDGVVGREFGGLSSGVLGTDDPIFSPALFGNDGDRCGRENTRVLASHEVHTDGGVGCSVGDSGGAGATSGPTFRGKFVALNTVAFKLGGECIHSGSTAC